MTVSKYAVRDFLNRRLENFSFIKEFGQESLKSEIKNLCNDYGIIFRFKTRSWIHQLACFYIGICKDQFLFLLDMGTGKSKIILDIISFRNYLNEVKRSLILVPNDIGIDAWEEEASVHSILKCIPMYGTTEERKRLLNEDGDLFIINYQGLMHLLCDNKEVKSRKGIINKMVINRTRLFNFADLFDLIVLDESHLSKNKDTIRFRICDALCKRIQIRYGLTGTPFGRHPEDLWAQFYLIDRGETLGETLGIFREAYFKTVANTWTGFKNYIFDDKKRKLLYRALQNKSIRYSDDECHDLPKRVPIIKRFRLPESSMEYYEGAVKGIIKANKDYKLLKNNFMRMRQIASGFMSLKYGDDIKEIVEFSDNPKIQVLEECLLTLPKNSKMVIWHEFVWSGRRIETLLKNLKMEFVSARGETKDTVQNIRKFKKDDACKILVINLATGAYGPNFQIANYEFFYESPSDPILRSQAEKRCRRPGQKKNRVYIIDPVVICKNSVEEKILEFLKEGKDLFDCIIEGQKIWR